VSDYAVSLLVRIGVEAFVALSAYLLLVIGRVSFGQQAFFVIGGYAAGIATALYGAPLAVGIMVGAVAAGVAGALLSAVMAPVGGIYFAAGSLAFGELVRVALLSFHYQVPVGADLTGPAGADGFRGVRALFTGGVSATAFMLAVAGLVALTFLAIALLLRSRWGEAMRMVGEDETASASLGVRVRRVAALTMAGAGALAGLGGGLFVHYVTYIEPGHSDVMLGVHSLAYAFIGGLGTPLGPIIGVALDIGLLESFRFLAGYRMIVFGGLVMGLLVVRPRGLLDEVAVHRLSRLVAWGRR